MCGGRGPYKHFRCMLNVLFIHKRNITGLVRKISPCYLFDLWWDEYCKHPKHFIHPEQYKAVQAIRSCRTAALGVDIYSCPQCGDTTEVYHNCKNRFVQRAAGAIQSDGPKKLKAHA